MRCALLFLCAGCLSEGLKVDNGNLAEIQGGSFLMGQTRICSDGKGDLCGGDHGQHAVTVDRFQIMTREVTRAAFGACIAAKSCQAATGLDAAHYRIDRPNDPALVNDPNFGAQYCAWKAKGLRLPTEAEFELVARGGNPDKLGDFATGTNESGNDTTDTGVHALALGPEWVADTYQANIGCTDRLAFSDACPNGGCSCGGDSGCQSLCLPVGDSLAEGNDGGSLACAPSSTGQIADVDPIYSGGVYGVVRGATPTERDCYRVGWVRRHAARGGDFQAGFRCASSETTPRTPGIYRFRLLGCPANGSVDVSTDVMARVDSFTQSGFSTTGISAGGTARGLACNAVFAVHPTGNNVTVTLTSSGSCTQTWTGSADLTNGDSLIETLSAKESGSGCSSSCGNADLMTDMNNCGACGHSCFATACIAGQCQPGIVAMNQLTPFDITANLNGLYWSNRTSPPGGSIWHCPIPSGSSFSCSPLVDSQERPGYLALDSSNIYWPNYDNSTIRSCGQNGCSSSPTTLDSPGGGALGTAIEGGRLLYTMNTGGTIKDCLLPDCTSQRTLVTNQTVSLNGPWGVAADASNVYFTINGANGALKSCPRNGCLSVPDTLVGGISGAGQILLDGGFVYFFTASTVERWEIASFTRQMLSKANTPAGLATDATHLYWTNGDNTLSFCLKDNCASTERTIASGQSSPQGITVFAGGVFWANSGNGTIMGMAAPLDSP